MQVHVLNNQFVVLHVIFSKLHVHITEVKVQSTIRL